jgi:hypothetical protein
MVTNIPMITPISVRVGTRFVRSAGEVNRKSIVKSWSVLTRFLVALSVVVMTLPAYGDPGSLNGMILTPPVRNRERQTLAPLTNTCIRCVDVATGGMPSAMIGVKMTNSDYYAVAANQHLTINDHHRISAELADAGVTMVRMRALRWADIQPVKNGAYNWGDWWYVYNAYTSKGIKIVVPLLDTPAWATRGAAHTGAPHRKPWRKFVRAAVEKFPFVYAWETWNEPDLKRFYTGSPKQFLRMHKVAYRQIKKYSNAQVWGPAVTYSGMGTPKGARIAYKVLDSRKLDMFTYHDYAPVDWKEANLLSIMTIVGDRYPISITEISSHWDPLYFDLHTEQQIANEITYMYQVMENWVKHVMWWSAKDWEGFKGGLIDKNGTGKRQLEALENLIKQ